jgi:hypothetical protein
MITLPQLRESPETAKLHATLLESGLAALEMFCAGATPNATVTIRR